MPLQMSMAVGVLPVDHDEAVAADAGHERLDHVQGGGGGQGGVDGVASLLQHADAGLGGQGVAGRDHAVKAHDDRAGETGS